MRTDTWTSATQLDWRDSLGIRETPPEYVLLRPRLYLETTIPSYLTARLSRDLSAARNQQITLRWWNSWRTSFDIYISEYVALEAGAGDPRAAARRMEVIQPYPLLDNDGRCKSLTGRLMSSCDLPKRAETDAAHMALAAVHAMEYLLTWNCTHLANAELAPGIAAACEAEGHKCPVICTPLQLLERYEYGLTD